MPLTGLIWIGCVAVVLSGSKKLFSNAAPLNYIKSLPNLLTLDGSSSNGPPGTTKLVITPIARFVDQDSLMRELFQTMQLNSMMNAFQPQPRMGQGFGGGGTGQSQGLAQQSMMMNPLSSGSNWNYNNGMGMGGMGGMGMGGMGGLGLLGLQFGLGKLLE